MPSIDNNLYRVFEKKFAPLRRKLLLETERGEKYTYADADTESARLANYLTARGIQPGDRISVQVEKSPQALWLYLACLRGGFVFHPLNTAYRQAELSYFVANAEPSLIICDEQSKPVFEKVLTDAQVEISREDVLTLNADGSGTLYQQCEHREKLAPNATVFNTVARRADDMATLLYSSGTTGKPKGIMLTHENLIANTLALISVWRFTENDCLVHALPIFHVHGLFVAIGCVVGSGASMLWLPKFDARQVAEKFSRATVMMGVPTYYTRLLREGLVNRDSTAAMRLFISGSAPLLEDTFTEFKRRTGHAIVERYGMTETNMNTSNPLDGVRKPGTVGLPLPGVDVRVVDGSGHKVAVGEVGNLQVRGANVFAGYWHMPEKTAEDFTDDGFFNTGDKAVVDADGYIAIAGRAKDMVISGGLNIYPKEIERVIDAMVGVVESAVIGVPHSDLGEGLVGVIVLEDSNTLTQGAIIHRLKLELAAFKVPKKIVFIAELPRNTMGKVQKSYLRDRYNDILTRCI